MQVEVEVLKQQLQALTTQLASLPASISRAIQVDRQQFINNQFQKDFSYKSFVCTTKPPVFVQKEQLNLTREPGTLFLFVPKPFILIDTKVIKQTQSNDYRYLDVDSDCVSGRTIYNHHMFLPDHPFIYLASYADCTQAITASGLYVIPDYRDNKIDDDMIEAKQIVFALMCNNFSQGGIQ